MTTTLLDDRIDRLTSLAEIRQLAYDYAYAVDTLDWELMNRLWVETETPEPFPILDIHAIRKLPEKFADQGASMLAVANHRIHFEDPDSATGTVYCLAFVDRKQFIEQSIIYVDDYRRVDGTWRFLKRNHLLVWGREAANPMQQPEANWPLGQVGAGNAAELLRHRPANRDAAM